MTALAPEGAVFDKLAEVRRERAPFLNLARRIVATALEAYPPLEAGPVVEIGAGDGQLRELLPESIAARVVHTEPTQRGVVEIGRRFGGARIERAPVEKLPFADGSAAAVLGLCVLDVLPDLGAAVRELGRVLAPGAPFVHFLDQSPFLGTVFERLVPLGLVPLPNVFEDPCATHWPQDLFFLEKSRLDPILATLRRQEHPLTTPLAHYATVFEADPFRVEQAIYEFDQLSASGALRRSLHEAFRDAYQGATEAERSAMGEFRGHAVSSTHELAARLFLHFSANGTFQVEVADVLSAAETLRVRERFKYQSLCVGQHRKLYEVPERTLAETLPLRDASELVREHGMLVLVAKRTEH